MGQDKAFVEIDGISMIERVLRILRGLFEETIIVANELEPYRKLDALTFRDVVPDRGALGGLYTGLLVSSFDYAFCVACDMPYLSGPLISYLADRIDDHDAVVPRTMDGLQPLHALYSKRCLDAIRRVMEEKKTKIIDFYPLVKLDVVPERDFSSFRGWKESFMNINTPEDLQHLKGGGR